MNLSCYARFLSLCSIVCIWQRGGATSSSSETISLHLTVAASNYPVAITTERNSSGYIIDMKGVSPHMIDWISSRFNISYSILQVQTKAFEGIGNSPGLVKYLTEGKCDIVLGAIAPTQQRLVYMDFSQGFIYTSYVFMIPMPETLNNFLAAVKPFQLSVWIGLGIAIALVCFLFYLTIFFDLKNKFRSKRSPIELDKAEENLSRPFLQQYFQLYVFRVLLSQGCNCPVERLTIRIIAGAWCLVCFVLVTSYNSVLISYVLSPNAEPLITSVYDLTNMSHVNLVVDKGLGFDLVLSNAKDGIVKQMKDKLQSYENSRCAKTDICVNQVKSGGHVYLNSLPAILQEMEKDFKATGKCNLALAKQKEYALPWVWALAKNSRFTESINRGILETRAFGLVDIWTQWYQTDIHQCLDEADRIERWSTRSTDDKPKLSLKNLISAFAVLIVGYLCSFLVFVFEKSFFYIKF